MNLVPLILSQLKTGDLVIRTVNMDLATGEVTIICKERDTQEVATQPVTNVPLTRPPEPTPQPAKKLTPDLTVVELFAELCGVHDNRWHAKRSFDRICRSEELDTPEKLRDEWVRRCTPKNGTIPDEAVKLIPLLLKEA